MKIDNRTSEYEKMTTMPMGRLILSLGIPTTITMLVTNIYNLVDTYFVSKLGASASGAIGIVFGLMAILQAVGFLLGQGAGSNMSRRLGAKDSEGASRFASTSFYVSLFSGVVIAALGLIFLDPLMRMLGSTDTILPYSRVYGTFILIAAPAMISSFVMNTMLRFEGKAKFAMIGITIGGILNMIGDPIFMFVFDMGIAGAGLSTALSQYISFFILYSMFFRGKSNSKLSIKLISKNLKDYINIFRTGLPSLVRQGLGSISTMLLNISAAPYGDGAIAAMSIVSRCCMFIFCVGLGIAQGFQPVAGYNYGAKKYSRVKEGFRFTLVFGTLLLGTFSIIGLMASGHVIGIFSKDPEIVRVGTLAFRLQCVALIALPTSVCGNMLFQSIGKSEMATVLSALRSGLFFIPLILILPRVLGLLGIQLAQPVADVLSSAVTIPFVVRFFSKMPKDEKVSQ